MRAVSAGRAMRVRALGSSLSCCTPREYRVSPLSYRRRRVHACVRGAGHRAGRSGRRRGRAHRRERGGQRPRGGGSPDRAVVGGPARRSPFAHATGGCRMTRILARAVSVAALVMLAAASTAAASTFTVNDTGDAGDANEFDGLCATATGVCTLRAAVDAANDHSGNDDIVLPEGTFDVSGATGDDDNASGDID